MTEIDRSAAARALVKAIHEERGLKMAKHTPGTWTVEGGRGRKGERYVWPGDTIDSEGTRWRARHAIATVHDEFVESAEANAALIAAAPELLAALRGLLIRYVGLVESGDAGYWNPETEEVVIKSRAAIEKAER